MPILDSYIKNIRQRLEKAKQSQRIDFEKWHIFVQHFIEQHNMQESNYHGFVPGKKKTKHIPILFTLILENVTEVFVHEFFGYVTRSLRLHLPTAN